MIDCRISWQFVWDAIWVQFLLLIPWVVRENTSDIDIDIGINIEFCILRPSSCLVALLLGNKLWQLPSNFKQFDTLQTCILAVPLATFNVQHSTFSSRQHFCGQFWRFATGAPVLNSSLPFHKAQQVNSHAPIDVRTEPNPNHNANQTQLRIYTCHNRIKRAEPARHLNADLQPI